MRPGRCRSLSCHGVVVVAPRLLEGSVVRSTCPLLHGWLGLAKAMPDAVLRTDSAKDDGRDSGMPPERSHHTLFFECSLGESTVERGTFGPLRKPVIAPLDDSLLVETVSYC